MTYPPKSYYSSPEARRGERKSLAIGLAVVLLVVAIWALTCL